jgi:NodT family efflux transporter outer membrane factor (OMF) lipoprotein
MRPEHCRFFAIVFMAGSVILLSACGVPQERVEADVDRATAEALPAVSEAWRAAESIGPVQPGWLAGFNDPVLEQLVAEAQANNPNLAAAAAGVQQAQALARQAGASLTPDLGLAAGAGRGGSLDSAAPGPSSSFEAGLQLSWEADLWGRVSSGVSQAVASAQAAEADYRFARYSIAANTTIAYFIAIEAQLQLDIAEDNLAIIENTQRIVQAQYDEGVASAQDLALSRSDLASAQEQLVALQGGARDAQRSLELLLGRYPAAEIELRQTLPDIPPPPPAGLPSELLERRPDLIAAEREVAAAFNATNQAKAARLPSLSLTANLGGASPDLGDLLNPANLAWTLGSNLLAPIFDGGRRRENVVISTAQQEQALARYSAAALQAFSEVESALDRGQTLATRNARLSESAAQAAEAFRIADIRYKEGETSLIDLLAIQQRSNAARSSQATIERQLLQQRVNLNLALGGSWD